MNTKNNVVVEVSPFLLFEACADSETHRVKESGHEGDDVKGREDYVDDAESCRWETSTSQMRSRSTDCNPVKEEVEVARENEEHDEGDGEVNSYQRWPEKRDRENLTIDLSSTGNDEKLISEMEKNRMFWEACLTS